MSAAGVVKAVVDALNRAEDPDLSRRCDFAVSDYITDVVAPADGGIPLDIEELEALREECDPGGREATDIHGAGIRRAGAHRCPEAVRDGVRSVLIGMRCLFERMARRDSHQMLVEFDHDGGILVVDSSPLVHAGRSRTR